jgi:hypothetical protein
MNTRYTRVLGFDLLFVAMFAYAAVQAVDFQPLARVFPLSVSVAGLVLSLVNLVFDAFAVRPHSHRPIGGRRRVTGSIVSISDISSGDEPLNTRRALGYAGTLLGYFVLVYAIGTYYASFLFIVAFLTGLGKVKWWKAVIGAAVAVGVLYLLASNLSLYTVPGELLPST